MKVKVPSESGADHFHSAASLSIATCAWSFDDWRGVFYPEHLPSNQRLEFYARFFNAVEIDSTFYAVPSAHAAGHWLDATPDDFVFAAKMSREITHDRKLRQCEELLDGFLAGIAPLRRKLACVLVQLPPYFTLKHDEQALREFVARLPGDFRFAIEFRDPGWRLPRVARLLEEYRVCWVWNDMTPIETALEGAFEFAPRTTDFLYVRLMGDLETKYGEDGSPRHAYRRLLWPRDASLDSWAIRVKQHLGEVARVLICANNHFEGFSPHTCVRIAERFGIALRLPTPAEIEGRAASDGEQMKLL